jgi:hypothetical protein
MTQPKGFAARQLQSSSSKACGHTLKRSLKRQ